MKLLKILIHNIASIADAEIDFSSTLLGNAPIFLITGETGAGKSTILDCICLALYDKTPRMTSIAKEDIGAGDDNSDRYYTNDNSQFLRRGTGEGWTKLFFEGNDGKEYEATWLVQRNYKKPDRKLQKPTRSLIATDGSYNENNKKIIPAKILEIVGLEYEQFCRTVMLAQGEFTKFLKSGKGDKSQILEKLTGTDIYSILGKRIAEKYLERYNSWERINHELKNVVVFSEEEISSRTDSLNTLQEAVKTKSKERDNIQIKIKWLDNFKNLSERIISTKEKIQLLEKEIDSKSFRESQKKIEDYKKTSEIRILFQERERFRSLIKKKVTLLTALTRKVDDINHKVQQKNDEIQLSLTKVSDKEKESRLHDLSLINKSINQLNVNFNNLQQLLSALKDVDNSRANLNDLNNRFDNAVRILLECDEKANMLSEKIAISKNSVEELSAQLEKVELGASKAAREIRLSLHSGDICPVCGGKVATIVDEKIYTSILKPLRENKKKADDNHNALLAEKIANNRVKEENLKLKNDLESKIKEQNRILDNCKKLLSQNLALCDMTDSSSTISKSAIKIKIDAIKQEIDIARQKQIIAEKIIRELQSIKDLLERQKSELITLKETESSAKLAKSECESDIKNNQTHLDETDLKIAGFFKINPDINEYRVNYLLSLKERDIISIENNITRISDNLKKEKGALDSLSEQIGLLEKSKPDLNENDEDNLLKEYIKKIDEDIFENNQLIGQINEQLKNDRELHKKLDIKIKEEEEARDEKLKWEGLYRLLGDNEGAKFRNVAQSFILRSLLDNANAYMQNFTERYTLTCNPGSLAILVKDCYRPSEPQPASILSGGESFMASLSLALALSNLRAGGNGADILFIDEGFGTLSKEYLGNVMETLEKLHQIGGRKVGLISHVPEMKERIPVQICVVRESPALSKIEVIGN